MTALRCPLSETATGAASPTSGTGSWSTVWTSAAGVRASLLLRTKYLRERKSHFSRILRGCMMRTSEVDCMRIMVGTIGQSILATDDDGEHWQRLAPRNGVHSDGIVRTLVSHPADPRVLLAGTDKGILRSEDGGRCWEGLGGPLSDQTVWRIAFHPKDNEVLFAGTGTPSRPAIYRSGDRGQTWAELDCDIAPDCDNVGVPRVTDIAIDPLAPDNMWASIEVDGARHSTDGGRTWSAVDPKVITNPDHHAVVVSPGPPKSVFIVVNNEIWVSRDEGASWQPVGVKQRFPYHHVRD